MNAPTTDDPAAVLETGWTPATPPHDTVLRRGVLALAQAWDAAGSVDGGRFVHDDRVHAVDTGHPSGFFNSATLLQPLSAEQFGATVDRIERFYARSGRGEVLLWSPWATPDLTDRGWALQGHPPLLYRPAGRPVTPRRYDGLQIVEVTRPDGLAAWNRLAVEAFPLPEVDQPERLLPATLLRDQRFRFTLARVNGRDVAIGCQVVVDGVNVLLLGAALPDARGRGTYAALVADRLTRHAHLPTVTIVSDDSRPVLVERFDFLPICRFTLWERSRP